MLSKTQLFESVFVQRIVPTKLVVTNFKACCRKFVLYSGNVAKKV